MPSHDDPASLEREISAWLETLAVDTSATLRDAPRSTIVPTDRRPSTGGRKALALLEQLAGRSPAASAQLRAGATIGEGGMGVVRLAEQVALGRTVAVKTLKPGRTDQVASLELLREAWVTGAVEHPNVVPIHYLGLDDDGRPLIVMKRVEGVEWSELIDDPDQVAARFGATDLLAWNLGILMQVLNALHFAHSRGIVHRDLKPANVMIGEFGEVYLLDWGIAVSLRDDGSGRLPLAADATEMAGTPCYMAPEMLGPERGALSERTDVYLAGAVLFEIIAGRPPHDGATALAVITSVVASQPTMPPGVPAELAALCARAMHADAAARVESAEALRQALQAYLEHRGSARLAALAGERLAELQATLAPRPDGTRPEREDVYRLFGACRFGFHEALVSWRDNRDAQAGLRRAIVAVAEYELGTDDPRAAIALLSELADAPAELLARARAAADDRARRQAELERLRAQHDTSTGTRTRMFVGGVLGTLFTTVPLVAALRPGTVALQTHAEFVAWAAGLLAVILGLGYWARDSMTRTLVNRRIFATGVIVFVAQMGFVLGAWRLDIGLVQTQVLVMALWALSAMMVALAIDRRLTAAAIGYASAFAAACLWPEHRFFAMSGGNLVFTINAVWHWRPAQLRLTDEERAALRRRRAPAPER